FVDLPLAGVGRRSLASLIDTVLVVLVSVALLAAIAFGVGMQTAAATPTLLALALVAPVVVPMAFELLGGGRSPGKRYCGLRIVSVDGCRTTATQIALRNVLRLVDFLPAGYGIGLTLVVATGRAQRLGDLVSGTLVIHESPDALPDQTEAPDYLAAVPKPLVHALFALAEHRVRLERAVFQERRRMLLLRFRELRPDWRALDDDALWRELAGD
ncbi:MAG: RDD family protein, partial [Myxococcota bacterium]